MIHTFFCIEINQNTHHLFVAILQKIGLLIYTLNIYSYFSSDGFFFLVKDYKKFFYLLL